MAKQPAKKAKQKQAMPISSVPRTRKLKGKDKKKVVRTTKKIPGSFRITIKALGHLWKHKKVFLLTFIIYAVLYTILVRGLAMNFQLSTARESVEEAVGADIGTAGVASSLFGALLSTAGETSGEAATVYQMILFILISLVIIWLLRGTYEDRKGISVKQAFYQSTYPLVQYLLVGFVIMIQALPALLGFSVYTAIMSNEITNSGIEQIGWTLVLALGVGLSSYLLSSSLFASYIVTLPGSEPMAALRSARKLVKYRRFAIIRKVLFLPFIALLFLLLVFIPLVLAAPVLAEILFMIVSMFGVFVLHAYFYTLYRELL